MEEALDELIKDCAHQLFDLTDDKENAKYPFKSTYVTYQDIRSIQAFQKQIVIAIKAPEETRLEIPIPKEDCIKVHVKSTKGPIDVYLCDVEQDKPGDKTSEDKEAVASETEPSVPPGEGSISHLHFYPCVIFFFFLILKDCLTVFNFNITV
uniref:E2F transcription factor CC-MB domain-containing protein n=1 Tax=Meleagris gallopavo TaxID=9103 RepID=G1NML2_MELGA